MTTPPDLIGIEELRKLVCRNVSQLSKNERQEVLDFCVRELPGKKIISAGDGCRISLDASICNDLVRQIHNLIQSKLVFVDSADFKN